MSSSINFHVRILIAPASMADQQDQSWICQNFSCFMVVMAVCGEEVAQGLNICRVARSLSVCHLSGHWKELEYIRRIPGHWIANMNLDENVSWCKVSRHGSHEQGEWLRFRPQGCLQGADF
jgi:hypothetical protein